MNMMDKLLLLGFFLLCLLGDGEAGKHSLSGGKKSVCFVCKNFMDDTCLEGEDTCPLKNNYCRVRIYYQRHNRAWYFSHVELGCDEDCDISAISTGSMTFWTLCCSQNKCNKPIKIKNH